MRLAPIRAKGGWMVPINHGGKGGLWEDALLVQTSAKNSPPEGL